MKEVKRPYTLYYESRCLQALALLDRVEGYMEDIRKQFDSDLVISEDVYTEKLKENGLLTELIVSSSRKRHIYESELEQLFIQNEKKNDFFEGRWVPEYH